MGGVGKVVYGKDERLGKALILRLMLKGKLFDLLQNPPVRVGRGDLLFDVGRVVLPLVFQLVELLGPGFMINEADLLPFVEEDPLCRSWSGLR